MTWARRSSSSSAWDGGDCSENSGCNTGCLPEYINDGECDSECNVAACGFDGDDCFARSTECYGEADGKDYRGTKNTTKSGKECQAWDAQFPQQHTRTHLNYPDGGLGGHNRCRNADGETAPWCYTVDAEIRYEMCDVGQPWQHCKQNEVPLATQQAGAVQCLNPTQPPSGPLPRFEVHSLLLVVVLVLLFFSSACHCHAQEKKKNKK
ncbi:Kringle-like protein [Pavlovales sp. CCMP2436]|nr:Kringle-like protein [Pavlovales sp. CCMP2436]